MVKGKKLVSNACYHFEVQVNMPTGKPTLGYRLKNNGCSCYPYHRPLTSAQHCECECHLNQMENREV